MATCSEGSPFDVGISTEGVTYGTSLPKPSRFSLQFQDRKLEKSSLQRRMEIAHFIGVFLLGLLNATFCIQTVLFRFLMQPRVYAQVAFSFISPIVICSVEIAVLLLCSRSFVKRWQHLLLIPGLTFTAGTMFIYLPYFTDVAEYRAGPVAFAYAFLYMIIFGVSLVPNSFYSALITLCLSDRLAG
ncbi:hypothetical protein BC829DRAFT_175140 [Chytridium lagenaria]|nr:hypothetical protein BC829DRAFT_175140 [Chytridium lagenaria]